MSPSYLFTGIYLYAACIYNHRIELAVCKTFSIRRRFFISHNLRYMDKIIHTHCCYCRRKFSETLKLTKEHFIPLSRTGHEKGENVLQCCIECNAWKADKMPEYWLSQVEYFFKKNKRFRFYTQRDYACIIGSLKHWIKFFKSKKICDYKV